MKIYYLKYYKGNIDVIEEEVSTGLYYGSYIPDERIIIQGLEFNIKDKGKILEYSLGDIRIWITGKGDLNLAYNKLRGYAVNFHSKNINRLEKEILEENQFLQAAYYTPIK